MFDPIEIIGKELFTLDAYLKNEEMSMHHERFKKMIQALKASIVALKFTQFVMEEGGSNLKGVFEDKDFPTDKDFTIWEYRKEIKDLLDHALNNYCIDCCCQKSWEALGLKEYTEKSIPEEIEKIMLENERLRLELETRPQGDFFPNPKRNKRNIYQFTKQTKKYCKL